MKTRDLYRHCRPGREEGRPAWRPAEANRSHARVGAFSMRGADDDPRYAQPSPKAPAPSRETARFQWQVRRGTRGHPGARGTDESRAIPRTTRVLLALPNGFPSWTSPVRPRSPALSRSSSPLVAGATAGSQGLTTPGWAQRPRRVATLPEPPFRAWAPLSTNCNPDPAT